jgi:hypothetical protein
LFWSVTTVSPLAPSWLRRSTDMVSKGEKLWWLGVAKEERPKK